MHARIRGTVFPHFELETKMLSRMAEESACPTIRRHNRCPPAHWLNRLVWTCLSTSFCKSRQSPPHRRGPKLRHEPHSLCPCQPSPIVLNWCTRLPYLTLQLC